MARLDRSTEALEKAVEEFRAEMARLHAGQTAIQADRASQKIIRRLERKIQQYVEHTGLQPTRVILATAQIHYSVVERLREMGIDVIQPEVVEDTDETTEAGN